MKSDVGIVIPFYYLSDNFETDINTLQETIESTRTFTRKIIVVDDGTKLSGINGAKLVKHNSNLGKGAALRTGLEYLLSDKDIKFIIEVDADNDQDPKEVVKFFEIFKKISPEEGYLVIGDRYSAPQMKNVGYYRESINEIQTSLFSQFGFKIRDSVSGFRGYSRNFANVILWDSKSKGFGIATEEIILAYLKNATLEEIPLEYAKPRKDSTKAYKLSEVLAGITIHGRELKKRGHSELVDYLNNIKIQIERKVNRIPFRIGGKEFVFRYNGDSYTIG